MENTVLIRVGFGTLWNPLIIGNETIEDMEIAIAIVKASRLSNVFLRKGTNEWDNL